jgi:adenylosuccinate synthase
LEGFEAKYRQARDRHIEMINGLNASAVAKGGTAVPMEGLEALEKEWMEAIAFLRGFQLVDSEHFVNKALQADKSILCEGAQGSLLDIDFGSYPFVTSSNTVCAGACTGLGIAPSKVGEVYGIFKAYCTRVGAGPFPTELFDETGAKIRAIGHEYGAVTGRERRCGWIDLVALRYTIMLNGVTQLLMMKSDVLDTFPVIKACTAYRVNGVETRDFPFSIDENVEPVYEEFPGWQTDLTHCTKEAELPEAFINYVNFLERELQTPIRIISVGPDREATIWR